MTEGLLVEGVLDRLDGARLHWERYGSGRAAALYLHGGPGSGLGTHYRSYFDPSLNTVVAFDQRGSSSMSVPHDLHRAWPSSSLIEIDDEGHFGARISGAVADAVRELSVIDLAGP